MENLKTPENYISRKIVYRTIKTGYDLKKILLNITDYKTVHELNNFYKTKWVPYSMYEALKKENLELKNKQNHSE